MVVGGNPDRTDRHLDPVVLFEFLTTAFVRSIRPKIHHRPLQPQRITLALHSRRFAKRSYLFTPLSVRLLLDPYFPECRVPVEPFFSRLTRSLRPSLCASTFRPLRSAQACIASCPIRLN